MLCGFVTTSEIQYITHSYLKQLYFHDFVDKIHKINPMWSKAVAFHLPLGYMFPPLHSPPQGDYFAGRRVGGSSGDGPSVSG